MRRDYYGTASGEEVDEAFKMATRIAGEIKSLPNPAAQNLVKELVACIRIQPVQRKPPQPAEPELKK
jgi:hypothetical protein